ncbi:MAG: thermonuclease family protein [Bacteroidales bacterium]|nr:thermonuclease family protein [Bacteroidales bacterium]
MLRCFILCLNFLFLVPDIFNAKVIGITDGDTIVVLTENFQQVKIRLEGIDCPEMKQDFGTKAKQATSELCYDKRVIIHKSGTDRYGRTLAYVYIGDKCINKELLKLGMAWHFKRYNSDKELALLETQAREQKVGLWAQQDPIAPWDFRVKK